MQLFSSFCKRLTGQCQSRRTPARKPTTRVRPQLEALDDRLVPSTLTVTNNLDTGVAGDGSLRGEIAAARSGDTIVFDPSLSGQTLFLANGELVINKSLTIQGLNTPLSPVTIFAQFDDSRAFEVDGASSVVSLSDLDILGGTGVANNPLSAGATDFQGGAIWNGGTLTVSACNLSLCSTAFGGAIYNAGTLTVSASTLTQDSAILFPSGGLGGAIYNRGSLTISNSALVNNSVGQQTFDNVSGGDGGAIYNAGTLTISNSAVANNTVLAGGYGGGIFNAYKASATITGSFVSGNLAEGNGSFDGGGIYNAGLMTLSGSTVSGNSDGIVNAKKGHLTIESGCSVVSNIGYDLFNLGVVKISKDSDVGVIGP